MIFPVALGLCIIAAILLEAFETIILPRRVTRRFRLTRAFYLFLWIPTRAVARLIRSPKTRESFLSFFGPLSLLILFAFWATLLIFGFGFLYYGNTPHDPTRPSLETCFYLSGTTFFTLGLGDVTPHTSAERVLAIFESGLGFGFLALIISYLPVIYQAFSKREVSIVLLDARAGSPPTATELLLRHAGPHGLDALLILFRDWEHWSAELLESHISYPVVSYFRSQHSNESWLAALATILDSTALLIATSDNPCSRQARLTFAMCRHAVADLAQVFFAKSVAGAPDRLPPEQLARMYASLEHAGYQLRNDEASHTKLKELRDMYEPYIHSLARYLYVELPPWILASNITENWKTSAWGRISGASGRGHAAQDIEDHF
ncbi:MAG TPA: potassium channel family protein [Candidatus Acidoferrales bacterium]